MTVPASTEWYNDPSVPVPLRYRLMYSPITTTFALAVVIVGIVVRTDRGVIGHITTVVISLWFLQSIYNWWTGWEYVRGMYRPDDSVTARVVEPDKRTTRKKS